jgi:hypothetical protein
MISREVLSLILIWFLLVSVGKILPTSRDNVNYTSINEIERNQKN